MTPRRGAASRRFSVQEALKQKVLSAFPHLSKNQRKVATALLAQPNDLPFLTTDQLARQLGVSKATIVRLAQSLGYRGFTELQREISGALQSDLSDVPEIIETLEDHASEDTLNRVAEADIRNTRETVRHADRRVFVEVVRMFVRARRVYVVGMGVSSLLAELLAHELHQVAVDVRTAGSVRMPFIEFLALAGPRDVVVGFSFPPYSRQTIQALAFARKRGAAVIAVTDLMTSPATFEAAKVIVVQTKNMLYTNSVAAVTTVINALATEVARKNKRTVSAVLQDVGRALDETDQYLLKRSAPKKRIP
jgi:DNA-binding MurR/RpiR family transcriptional regulator